MPFIQPSPLTTPQCFTEDRTLEEIPSPIVRPARHDWDVFSLPVQSNATAPGVSPTQITHASFYDMQSLDIAADEVKPGGTKLLISTTGYPIGALLDEFIVGTTGRDKIFQITITKFIR